MKTTLFMLCLLCATGAFGQTAAGVLTSEPHFLEFPAHEQQARQQDMGEEKSLYTTGTNVSAQGVRPLWELAPVHYDTPLGDTARMLKKQHGGAKKADIVWEN